MKLLVVLPSIERGGVEEFAFTIASGASQAGWQVHAAFPRHENTTTLASDFSNSKVRYHPLAIQTPDHRRLKSFTEYIPHCIRTALLLFKVKPDVVLVPLPWTDYCLGTLLACAVLQVPTVVVFQLMASCFEFSSYKLKLYHWIRSRKQQWVAVSETSRRLVSESFQIPLDQVLCIFNGAKITPVDHSQADIQRSRDRLRQELSLPQDSQIALTVGRLVPQKGYSDLVPVIPELVRDFPNLRFVWVGEGEQREELQNRIQAAGIADKVLLLGYRADIPKLLQAADLFVFPTRYEGLPFALLEAMAYRLPIVASDTSSIPEILKDQVHGRLFHSGNAGHLLETLGWALQHPNEMQVFAQSAETRIEEFSEEKMLNKTLALLKRMRGI